MELYKKYRPKEFADVVGQGAIAGQLATMVAGRRVPHAVMFNGPSGCGKTTLARILKDKIGCGPNDYFEVNAASSKGIDMVRDIQDKMGLAPMGGRCRVWVVDECHKLTGDAQNAFLKSLEDTPKHVYFMLCTTDPQKLLATIKTRCTEIKVQLLSSDNIRDLVKKVAAVEAMQLNQEVVEKIAYQAAGSARKALVLLDAIVGTTDADTQLDIIAKNDVQSEGIDLARKLMSAKSWSDIAPTLATIKDEPEGIRHLVLGYAKSVLLKAANPRAVRMLRCFRAPFYDSHMPGLVLACYDTVCDK